MTRQDNVRENPIWTCKIGFRGVVQLPDGSDGPMRRAVEQAFRETANVDSEFCFSGWGGELDERELAVVEDREPDPVKVNALDGLNPDAVAEVIAAAQCLMVAYHAPGSDDLRQEFVGDWIKRLEAALAKMPE